MATCDLCGEEGTSFRGALFGGKQIKLCEKCLAQFQIEEDSVAKKHIVLHNRPKEFVLSEKVISTHSNEAWSDIACYTEKDIQELIREIKRGINNKIDIGVSISGIDVFNIIDKSVGGRFE